MQKNGLLFLLQQTIGSEGKITVPYEVRKLLFSDPESTENLYIWNHDTNDDYIIISKDSLREKQSSTLLTSPVEENNPRRTTIPAKVRKQFNLEKDDELYFVTPEAVKSGTPAVFIWTFEQIEEIILGGTDEGGSEFPRKPHF